MEIERDENRVRITINVPGYTQFYFVFYLNTGECLMRIEYSLIDYVDLDVWFNFDI